jgi:hypothetical protein
MLLWLLELECRRSFDKSGGSAKKKDNDRQPLSNDE